jgi:hypothetical protein
MNGIPSWWVSPVLRGVVVTCVGLVCAKVGWHVDDTHIQAIANDSMLVLCVLGMAMTWFGHTHDVRMRAQAEGSPPPPTPPFPVEDCLKEILAFLQASAQPVSLTNPTAPPVSACKENDVGNSGEGGNQVASVAAPAQADAVSTSPPTQPADPGSSQGAPASAVTGNQ